MTPESSRDALEFLIKEEGLALPALSVAEGFRLMLDFYEAIAAEGCEGVDRDMLLFQWGTHDWGKGRFFNLNLTRQFIQSAEDPDDESMSQLKLTFFYEPQIPLEQLVSGNRWCGNCEELAEFKIFIAGSAAFHAVAAFAVSRVELDYDFV